MFLSPSLPYIVASLAGNFAESWGMHALTCCRSKDAQEECWHVFYGDVRIGTIAIRSGNPANPHPWEWHCGFYPGSHPRECTKRPRLHLSRRAPSLRTRGGSSSPGEPRRTFGCGAISRRGRQRSIGALIAASACPTSGARRHEQRWQREFDQPIPLPDGGKLSALRTQRLP
jgi:hypothetical protein